MPSLPQTSQFSQESFFQVCPYGFWMMYLRKGHYSCFLFHHETSCYFSLPRWQNLWPSGLVLNPCFPLSVSVFSSCAQTRQTCWLPLIFDNQQAPCQRTVKEKMNKQKDPLPLSLELYLFNMKIQPLGKQEMRAAVYQKWMFPLIKPWKLFSLTSKDVSNCTPGEKLDSVASNA